MCSILITAVSRGNNEKHRKKRKKRRSEKGIERNQPIVKTAANFRRYRRKLTGYQGVELVSFPWAKSAFPTRNPTDRDSSRTLTLRGLSLPRDFVSLSLSFNLSFFRTFSRVAEISLVLGFISPCRGSPGSLYEPRR